MTYTTHNNHAGLGASLWQRALDLNTSWTQSRARNQAYRSTVSQLLALSNRELIDMGLDRADIHDIARQAAYGA